MLRAHYRMTAPPAPDVIVRWTARFWSVATVALVLGFVVGEGIHPSAAHEWVGLLFFPVGVCAGMVVAWRREAAGGSITVASLLAFYVVSLVTTGAIPRGWAFFVFAAPGLLFLIAWALSPPSPPEVLK